MTVLILAVLIVLTFMIWDETSHGPTDNALKGVLASTEVQDKLNFILKHQQYPGKELRRVFPLLFLAFVNSHLIAKAVPLSPLTSEGT